MRVVVLTQWFPPEKAAIPADIAHGLAERGHEVTVLTGFPNYPTGRIYEGWHQRPRLDAIADGVLIRRVALYPSHDRSPVRRAAGYLSFGLTSTVFGWAKIRSADVIYVYHPPLTSATGPWLSRALAGRPYVLHVQDLWPDSVIEAGLIRTRSKRAVSALLTQACDAVYRRASGIVTIAPTMADLLHERGVDRERLHVIPNWADEAIFHPVPKDLSVADRLGTTPYFTVMFAGNIGDVQALDVAVRAASLVQDLSDFRLVLVGEGVALQRLKALVQELALTNVAFVPTQPQSAMNLISAAADVQLVILRDLPFLRGTVPSKLAAILASGLPVICSVGGDAARMTRDSGAGWSCDAEDVNALADAFRAAYSATSVELQQRGEAARTYYEANLSREAGVSKLDQVLRTVAEPHH